MKPTRTKRQSVYDQLWIRFKSKEFTFEDCLAIIFNKKKFSEKEIKYASKLINEMEDNGYVVHRKADYDQRVHLYRVLHPEMVSNAWAIYKKFQKGKSFTIADLIKEANVLTGWDYMYIKDTSICFWTNYYRSSDVIHISVLEENLDGWISLFKLFGSSVIVDDIIVSGGRDSSVVSLCSELDTKINKQGKNHMQLPGHTVIDTFKDNDMLGALGILVVQKNKLDWDKLVDLARNSGLINILGFSLDCINYEANKEVFSQKLINRIRKYKQKETEKIKGIGRTEDIDLSYKPLENKWNVKCLRANVFKKITIDLVRT